MKENKFNQKKFRELLKKGIGLRTQKEFAAQAGMSPATINRMLNEDVIARPKIKTLEALTNHMHNVTYSELMDACGYETPGIEVIFLISLLFLMGSAFSQAWKQCLKDFILLYRGMGCRSSE